MVLVSYKNELYQKNDAIFGIKLFQDLRQKKSFIDLFNNQSDNEEEIIVVPSSLTKEQLYCIKCYLKYNALRVSQKYTPQTLINIWKSNNFPTFDQCDEFKLFELHNKIETLKIKLKNKKFQLMKIERGYIEEQCGYWSSSSHDSGSDNYSSNHINANEDFHKIFKISAKDKYIIDIKPKTNIYKYVYDNVIQELIQYSLNKCKCCCANKIYKCEVHRKLHEGYTGRIFVNDKTVKYVIKALKNNTLNNSIELYRKFKYAAMCNMQLFNKIDIINNEIKELTVKCYQYIT